MGRFSKLSSYIIYFYLFALVSRESAALSSTIQHAMPLVPSNSVEIGEWSVLTVGSLRFPCCVRNTAWSSFWRNDKWIRSHLWKLIIFVSFLLARTQSSELNFSTLHTMSWNLCGKWETKFLNTRKANKKNIYSIQTVSNSIFEHKCNYNISIIGVERKNCPLK